MKNNKPSRGQIWIYNPDPTKGHEQAKMRPCIIVSTNGFNHGPGELAVIVPITSQYRKLSWLVEIKPPEGGLTKTSYALCNQIRTIALERLSNKPLGMITAETMIALEERLRTLLELYSK